MASDIAAAATLLLFFVVVSFLVVRLIVLEKSNKRLINEVCYLRLDNSLLSAVKNTAKDTVIPAVKSTNGNGALVLTEDETELLTNQPYSETNNA